MNNETNPAGRLHSILVATSKQPDNKKVREIWASVLECEESDDMEVTSRVIELYSLKKEVEQLIKLVPDLNHEIYLSSFAQLDRAIFPLNLAQNWQQPKQALTGEVLTRLEFCADALGKHYSEETIDPSELEAIRVMVTELYGVIEKSSIDPALRLALLEELNKIQISVSVYVVKGAKGVKSALQSLLGAVIANREPLEGIKDSHQSTLDRLGKIIDKLDVFTSRALKLTRILSNPVKFALSFLDDSKNEEETDSEVGT